MVKGKSLLIGAGISVAIVILLVCFMGALDVTALSKTPDDTQPIMFRSDIITFDNMKAFGKLEKTKAIFLHDQHTDALEKKNKDCTACHKSENARMSQKFMRLKDINREELTKIYCDNCTKCHTEMIAAGEKAGPVKCDECHKERPLIQSSRVPMGFDKSLHFRHYRAQENKCDRCHHEYDNKSQKLFYAEGKEGTCRYCHKEKPESDGTEKVISMRFASHIACIDCHQKTRAKHMNAGPLRCAGCHDAKEQLKIEKVINVPRLKRGQPDNVIIKTGDEKGRIARMEQVPFDHKSHEEYNDTCRVCHLASLESCATCHPMAGSKKATKNGREITLETAFHKHGHQSSCTGCHESKQQDKNCAGCHAFMTKTGQKESSACLRCHMVPLPERTGELSTSNGARMARLMPQLWKETFGPIYKVDVPKTVVLKDLVNQYEPAEYPHRKVFDAMIKKLDGSKLAQYFHYDDTMLCRGCHHNTPVAGKPPRCANCHDKPFNENNLFRPGIMGSFHQQCIGCHQKMGIVKYTGCTSCHKERKKES
jgi:hypothetical protein